MTPFSAKHLRLLNFRTAWADQAAAFAPGGDAALQALADGRFGEAMARAQAAFGAGDDAAAETMGLAARLAGNHGFAAQLFALDTAPVSAAWRNRAAAAIRARAWDDAAEAFARGAAEPGAHADWCREGLGLLLALAERWSEAAECLGPPGEAADRGLGLHAHLCRIAAAFALGRDLGPDIRRAALDGDAAPAPNSGSGDPGRTVGGDLIAFLACDPKYLARYGLAALAAFAEAHSGLRLAAHLHLYDADAASRALAAEAAEALGLDLALTTEAAPAETDAARRGAYYACARFCRLAEALPRYTAPAIALDADALVRGDLSPLAARVPAVGLATAPLSVPWNRHPAGFAILRPNAAAAAFLADVAALIGDSLGRGRRLWFLDQWALLIAARRHPVRRIPADWTYDTGFRAHAWVWQASDSRKAANPTYLSERNRLLARATPTR